ncbi:RNA polymerase sigma factor [Nocardia bhagyanarayanae]|uniref:RNA polymerase ECF family sigma subunit n=1 Tax=Nocardia bhagyanarayanae TaxID=1215925 RepID=A0A543FCH1_9NOCA|nr:sigma-70 family RNA polymerase sigma factor [Nocardia bhagyanarayanae]TQM31579.1 RNA polymerase ECF family sigma subunit [Nocardia bhagyanarayanae]
MSSADGPASDHSETTAEIRRAEAELVARAVDGDRDAVAAIIRMLQDPIYRLALRMVWRPAEAEDATQEILIRAVTRLATFRGEAKLLTWAYRIGVNYLINLRTRTPQEARQLSLEEFGAGLTDGLAAEDYRGPQAALLSSEVRLACSQGMLQCLARDERVAFVLGQVFEVSSTDAAWILDISPVAYRKRLERARKRLAAFLSASCGIADPRAACRCSRRVEQAVELGRIDTAAPQFAAHPVSPGGRTVLEAEEQMIRLHDVAAVLRGHPDYAAPHAKIDAITGLLTAGRFSLLE